MIPPVREGRELRSDFIFRLFWGVGGIWDVLINSEAGKQIENIQSFYIAILMLISMLGICIYIYNR